MTAETGRSARRFGAPHIFDPRGASKRGGVAPPVEKDCVRFDEIREGGIDRRRDARASRGGERLIRPCA
jgi:hypothetical protein